MSKRGYISRYLLILKKLKAKPYSTYVELQEYIENQFEYLQMQNEGSSKRTLQRDFNDIRNTFGIDIEYSKSLKGYFISQDETENMNFQRMIEAFDMYNSLNISKDLTPFVHLEKRRPQGTEHLFGLIHAIKNKLQIIFDYQKFWEENSSPRLCEPYALKEFKSRWYLIARDVNDGLVKTFGLERLSNIDITKGAFEFPETFNIGDNFRYCFGVINLSGQVPEEIILSFDPIQGKYIKSLPLHETQVIIVDNEDELQVKLTLFVTLDFIMEILSHGDYVKVIAPQSLVDRIKVELNNALIQYK